MNTLSKRDQFLAYLKENGPQTYDQLSKLSFWPGVAPRLTEFVKKGIIERVEVFNEDSYSFKSRSIVTGFKYIEGGEFISKRNEANSETLPARIRSAIMLLEKNGYKVDKI